MSQRPTKGHENAPPSLSHTKGVSRQKSIEIIQTAIAEGYQYVIESNIEDFFPSVDHDILTHLVNCYLPQDNYEFLVCDIEELFRARIDRFIIRLINLKVFGRDDFVEAERGLILKKDTVKKFIEQFEAEVEKKSQKDTLSLKEYIYIQTITLKKWALENKSLSFYRWNI
ncbi:MAG: hypothetical protein CV087_14265 [Candidatus Brocadia sp. WS118]|nr:MAG: hypothetical protein CV087_14265 [Candidatus Brocadia sp. WS118]